MTLCSMFYINTLDSGFFRSVLSLFRHILTISCCHFNLCTR